MVVRSAMKLHEGCRLWRVVVRSASKQLDKRLPRDLYRLHSVVFRVASKQVVSVQKGIWIDNYKK